MLKTLILDLFDKSLIFSSSFIIITLYFKTNNNNTTVQLVTKVTLLCIHYGMNQILITNYNTFFLNVLVNV